MSWYNKKNIVKLFDILVLIHMLAQYQTGMVRSVFRDMDGRLKIEAEYTSQ